MSAAKLAVDATQLRSRGVADGAESTGPREHAAGAQVNGDLVSSV